MNNFAASTNKPQHYPNHCWLTRPNRSLSCFRSLIFRINPFWLQLAYFLYVSLVGYFALRFTKPRTATFSPTCNQLDIFFTSVSASTVSSMSTVEMEVFSNTQLVIITILMFLGGEVFTSMLELLTENFKFSTHDHHTPSNQTSLKGQVELGLNTADMDSINDLEKNAIHSSAEDYIWKYNSTKTLFYVVMGYLLVVHLIGSSLIALYTTRVVSARRVLESKSLHVMTFSVFATVSSFANCGFLPTNENMVAFRKNSGLLMLLIPLLLVGNTLYAPCLRLLIWVLEKLTKRPKFGYILRNYKDSGYCHLLSSLHCWFLVGTVLVFIVVQLVVFCRMEWNSEAMNGMDCWEKLVGASFQVVNSRHAGESVVDLSIISPAILVLFVLMMYLPPYTSFMPIRKSECVTVTVEESKKRKNNVVQCLVFSQLTYLIIFIILICITERQKLKNDPLNFNVLNITIEVVSAYGNVGFSTGYSCKRQLKPEASCHDALYGLVGKWSDKGKVILILVMFFGRLKRFGMKSLEARLAYS